LAQNTSWKNVEKGLDNLRRAKALNNKALEKISVAKLARLIKPAGYYNQKARKLKEFARFYQELRGKEPKREKLLEVWGIGPETADSMLLYAYNKPFFVVDSYTKRILSRLGICKSAEKCSYDEIQKFFHKKLPRNARLFNEFHALLVEHAKRSCGKKAEAKRCEGCVVRRFCEI
jgi:endonuclease-3 related protein